MRHPDLFFGVKVIEAGSLNINGTVRDYFDKNCEYVGIDAKAGKGVEHVGLFHEYNGKPFGYFDVAVSTETFEHDPFWRVTLNHMIKMVRNGGAVMVSCAGPARGPHGVAYFQDPKNPKAIRPEYHPLGPEHDYYWNIRPDLLLFELLQISGFELIEYEALRRGSDICLLAKGKYAQPINYNRGEIANLRKREMTKV